MNGTLGPLEIVLWHYAYGKPKESVALSGPDSRPINPQVTFYIPKNGRDTGS